MDLIQNTELKEKIVLKINVVSVKSIGLKKMPAEFILYLSESLSLQSIIVFIQFCSE